MSSRPLRQDQAEMLERIRESLRSGKRYPLVQYPTGGGKTRIMTEVSKLANKKGGKTILFAPRRELIKQAAADLKSEGLNPSIIMRGYAPTRRADSYVASFDTVNQRALLRDVLEMPEVALAHTDEAHLSITEIRMKIMRMMNCPVVGWTATPAITDGRGLGLFYDDLLIGPSPEELMEMGVLVRPKYYGCPADIDFDELEYSKKTGDFTEKALGSIEDKATLIGDVVTNWERLARDRHTVVFATTIKHALNLTREFQRKGYRAACLDYTTPEPERASILERVASRDIQVLCNVFIASYGLDIPSLDCAVIARPTRNISLYLQTIGRVLRRDRQNPNKVDALIIDHVRAVQDNGFAEDAQPWCLDSEGTVKERKAREQKENKEPKPITCENCKTIFHSARICPDCGHQMLRSDEQIPAHDYTLEEIKVDSGKEQRKLNKNTSKEDKEWFWRQLNYVAYSNNYNPGWVSHKYRLKFGVWPNAISREGREKPTADTYAWLTEQRSGNRYAASKKNSQRNVLTETQSLI